MRCSLFCTHLRSVITPTRPPLYERDARGELLHVLLLDGVRRGKVPAVHVERARVLVELAKEVRVALAEAAWRKRQAAWLTAVFYEWCTLHVDGLHRATLSALEDKIGEEEQTNAAMQAAEARATSAELASWQMRAHLEQLQREKASMEAELQHSTKARL